MAADHDQVASLFRGEAVDFLARLPVDQVALLAAEVRIAYGEGIQAFTGLVELLLLQHRQVHRHVPTEGHGHGLDHMHHREPGLVAGGQGRRTLHHRVAFVGQVDGDQNVLIGHERLLPEGDSVFIMDFRAARGTCSVALGKKLLRRGRIRL